MLSGNHNLQILRGMDNNRLILSCNSEGTKVDLWNKDDGSGRQEWTLQLVPGHNDVYNIFVTKGISSNRKFLSCSADGTIVDLWHEDDGSGRQWWEIKQVKGSPTPNTYYIRIHEGVSSSRRFLSCPPDGSKVDLWDKDDGSGRQRWQIQNVWVA